MVSLVNVCFDCRWHYDTG